MKLTHWIILHLFLALYCFIDMLCTATLIKNLDRQIKDQRFIIATVGEHSTFKTMEEANEALEVADYGANVAIHVMNDKVYIMGGQP